MGGSRDDDEAAAAAGSGSGLEAGPGVEAGDAAMQEGGAGAAAEGSSDLDSDDEGEQEDGDEDEEDEEDEDEEGVEWEQWEMGGAWPRRPISHPWLVPAAPRSERTREGGACAGRRVAAAAPLQGGSWPPGWGRGEGPAVWHAGPGPFGAPTAWGT